MKHAAVLLAEGFEEIEAITPIDLLRRGGVEVKLVGVTQQVVTGAHGITVNTDILLEEVHAEDLDCIVLPGGMPGSTNLAESDGAAQLIMQVFRAGKVVAAICAAPAVVLAPLGILEGRQATCYPGAETFAPGTSFSTLPLVRDGNLITAYGPGAAAEFAIAVLQALAGPERAHEVKSKALFT